MNVRKFITQHPDVPINLMTQDGYINLSPDDAKALLEGKSAFGHPGDPEYKMEIPADVLLMHTIQSIGFSHGAWHLLTDYRQELNQEQYQDQDDGMDRNEILERLREKLDRNIDAMQKEWHALSPSLVAGRAQEIEAARVVYNELYSGWAYSDDMLEHLLRFENPLEVVRDKWIEEQCLPDVSEEMNHALFSIMNTPDAEHEYELDKEYTAAVEPDAGMKML